eukprot:c18944_g2_i1 orf=153-467(+)
MHLRKLVKKTHCMMLVRDPRPYKAARIPPSARGGTACLLNKSRKRRLSSQQAAQKRASTDNALQGHKRCGGRRDPRESKRAGKGCRQWGHEGCNPFKLEWHLGF